MHRPNSARGSFQAWYPVRSRQLNLCHCRRLDSKCDKVFALQMMHVGFAAGAGQRDQLHVHHIEIIAQPPCSVLGVEPRLEFRLLSSNADRTQSRMTVMTIATRGGEPGVV